MLDEKNRNFVFAIILSIGVLILWQVFYAGPKMREEQARLKAQQQASELAKKQAASKSATQTPSKSPSLGVPGAPGTPGAPTTAGAPTAPNQVASPQAARQDALKASKRISIRTPSLMGSISLKGARIDDLVLKKYRVEVEKNSDNVILLSPSKSNNPYYAEYGWVGTAQNNQKLPDSNTIWQTQSTGALTQSTPLILTYDNGTGLIFKRTIALDENYLFTVKQEVENKTGKAVTLFPYALISRHGRPKTESFYILHEGLVGVLGEQGLQEIDYDDIIEEKAPQIFNETGGWVGITDKYWATTLIPDQKLKYQARVSANTLNGKEYFQTDYRLGAVTIAPGTSQAVVGHLFAGAKTVSVIDSYEDKLGIQKFELLIDWGWFHFLTKPLFFALDYFFKLVGNFGVSILIVTVLIKLVLFPLANKSYVSMSKMKKLQPEMVKLRERYGDDRVRQQQAMMELYKKEKVNPMSGCLPILVQIPVFFALYKVLFVTIEMRHAPFFGWVQDLSARDPTSMFNLFGLIPWEPPSMLMIGIWPIIMGITMWIQMQLNPQQADPIQQKIFTWMPVVFTFILAPFPAGLVIYWAWNNTLSVIQQWFIMSRQGVKVDLFENMGVKGLLAKVGKKS